MKEKRNPAVTSRIMSRIKSKNTKVERVLGKEMWSLGLRYRKYYKLIGKPDFVFICAKVVVFCDGDFWHGRDFTTMVKNGRFDNNPGYWIPKMIKTQERDKRITLELEKSGWFVIRLWETDVLENPAEVARNIRGIVKSRSCNQTKSGKDV